MFPDVDALSGFDEMLCLADVLYRALMPPARHQENVESKNGENKQSPKHINKCILLL